MQNAGIAYLHGDDSDGALAEEKNTEFLGKAFPDFTVTDTEGKTFTLSEALKDHEAVLINFWATWCTPCQREFPFLNDAYAKYGDKVAFIALDADIKNDTIEKIAEFKKEHGINFPMGRDENGELYKYVHGIIIPDTVIVDRFGNAVFFTSSAVNTEEDLNRVLEAATGDGYTQSRVIEKIPREDSTLAFPVSAARALYPENGNYKKVVFNAESIKKTYIGWIVPDEAVTMRAEADADAPAENARQAYIIHVVDQNNQPVEEVVVNFCTDKACTPGESDEKGTVTFAHERTCITFRLLMCRTYTAGTRAMNCTPRANTANGYCGSGRTDAHRRRRQSPCKLFAGALPCVPEDPAGIRGGGRSNGRW